MIRGTTIGVIKGDARSLDYSSCRGHGFRAGGFFSFWESSRTRRPYSMSCIWGGGIIEWVQMGSIPHMLFFKSVSCP